MRAGSNGSSPRVMPTGSHSRSSSRASSGSYPVGLYNETAADEMSADKEAGDRGRGVGLGVI